jgi:hypothetical protein
MTTAVPSLLPAPRTADGPLRRAWTFSPLLTLAGLASLALIPLFILAALVDPRTITGAPAWHKPLKFALSIVIFGATFIWLLTFVDRPDRTDGPAEGRQPWTRPSRRVRWIAGITGFALLVEIGLITLQVLRNTTSHFNMATPFDAAVFSTMGGMITAVSVCTLLLAIWLIRQRLPDRVFAWSLRLGVLLSFVGMMVAFLMTTPTAAQLDAAQAGAGMAVVGAHSVGVADGGPGLPLLGWSTVGGDLRAPHFFGLHAMQVLPLIGGLLAFSAARRRWTERGRLALVWTAGLGYLGLILLLTWQALRGQSIVAPDALTLAVFGFLAGATALAASITLLASRLRQD